MKKIILLILLLKARNSCKFNHKFSNIKLKTNTLKNSDELSCDDDVSNDNNAEKRLKNRLFCSYDKNIRPGKSEEATVVNVRFNVKDFDFDGNRNTMTISSWMTLAWSDSRLSWNSAEFSGIPSIHMKSDSLWNPDLKVYNAHIYSSLGTCHTIDCIITNTSRLACVQPCEFTAHCKDIGIKNWPFDVQNCTFTFGNWMKSGEELNFNAEKVTLVTTRTKKSNQWKLLQSSVVVNKGKYESLNESYPTFSIAFVIERHNGFFVATIFGAAVVLMTCNLIVFCIPPNSLLRIIMSGFLEFSIMIYHSFLFYL